MELGRYKGIVARTLATLPRWMLDCQTNSLIYTCNSFSIVHCTIIIVIEFCITVGITRVWSSFIFQFTLFNIWGMDLTLTQPTTHRISYPTVSVLTFYYSLIFNCKSVI